MVRAHAHDHRTRRAQAGRGRDLGTSDWHEVTQEAIDAFADVTGDHQWIHVDVERAKETPFGGTIAHGYYTLSLAPMLTEQVFALEGFAFARQLRRSTRSASRRRCRSAGGSACTPSSTELEDIPGGAQMTVEVTFEREGGDKPVCVAETIARVYTAGLARSRTAGPASPREAGRR